MKRMRFNLMAALIFWLQRLVYKAQKVVEDERSKPQSLPELQKLWGWKNRLQRMEWALNDMTARNEFQQHHLQL